MEGGGGANGFHHNKKGAVKNLPCLEWGAGVQKVTEP